MLTGHYMCLLKYLFRLCSYLSIHLSTLLKYVFFILSSKHSSYILNTCLLSNIHIKNIFSQFVTFYFICIRSLSMSNSFTFWRNSVCHIFFYGSWFLYPKKTLSTANLRRFLTFSSCNYSFSSYSRFVNPFNIRVVYDMR